MTIAMPLRPGIWPKWTAQIRISTGSWTPTRASPRVPPDMSPWLPSPLPSRPQKVAPKDAPDAWVATGAVFPATNLESAHQQGHPHSAWP